MSETTSKAPSSSSTIDITSLSFEQLVYLKKELEAVLFQNQHKLLDLSLLRFQKEKNFHC
jgi:hypothetical protein